MKKSGIEAMGSSGATHGREAYARQRSALATRSDLETAAIKNVADALNALGADVFALYLKTKNFHWHMTGPNFRDYHLLLDEHSEQLFAMTDPLAERVRKLGESTLKSIAHIARLQRIADNDADSVEPGEMIAELARDNQMLAARLREVHDICDAARDFASTGLIDNWIDETEKRAWFLFEISRRPESTGH